MSKGSLWKDVETWSDAQRPMEFSRPSDFISEGQGSKARMGYVINQGVMERGAMRPAGVGSTGEAPSRGKDLAAHRRSQGG